MPTTGSSSPQTGHRVPEDLDARRGAFGHGRLTGPFADLGLPGPERVVGPVVEPFGMRHQTENTASGVANTCDVV